MLLLRASIQKLLCCQIPLRHLRRVRFPHPVGIVIGDGVRIGEGVRIYQNVTIGRIENAGGVGSEAYPVLEDDVFVYAGAVICGGITVGARSIVGANALITRDIPPDSVAFGYNQYKPREKKAT